MPLRNPNRLCQSVCVCPATRQFHAKHATVAMMSTFLLEIQTESGEGEWRHDRLVCCKCNTQGLSTQYQAEKLDGNLSFL